MNPITSRYSTRRIAFAIGALLAGSLLLSHGLKAQQPSRQLVQTNSASTSNNKRIALVIGNGAYTTAPPLKNPPNDARDMAAVLQELGFDVTSGINVNQRDFKRLVREFGQKIKAGGSGLFYYAGHGVQSKGRNYLIPANADITSETDVEDQAVDLNLVLGLMDEAQNGLNIVILDACRNNPFARSFRSAGNGLAQVDAPTGTLIAYATSPGRVASDGQDRNGLYTSELLSQMRVTGISVEEVFKRVRAVVQRQTSGQQVPWESSSLVGNFYFAPPKIIETNATGNNAGGENRVAVDTGAFELSYWETIKNSTNADDFKAYLEKYPNGQFAALAKNRISSLSVSTKPAESKSTDSNNSAAEITFWDSIKNSNNPEDFKDYLKKYPNGVFAELAKNRLQPLEAAIKEKEEAKRIAAGETKPIRSFKIETVWKAGWPLGDSDPTPGTLYIFKTRFLSLPLVELRELTEEYLKTHDKVWNCQAFARGRVDGLWIREVRSMDLVYRLRFQSTSEAAEALDEIRRICSVNQSSFLREFSFRDYY